jgi:hypothetical protein
MDRETLRKLETLGGYAAVTWLLSIIATGAFSDTVREAILKRDRYRSVESGARQHLEAAHIDHNKKNPNYDTVENGVTLTRREHYKDHVKRAGENGLHRGHNEWALRSIWNRLSDHDKAILREEGYTAPPGVEEEHDQLSLFDTVSTR